MFFFQELGRKNNEAIPRMEDEEHHGKKTLEADRQRKK
jgi:hypothetical protein